MEVHWKQSANRLARLSLEHKPFWRFTVWGANQQFHLTYILHAEKTKVQHALKAVRFVIAEKQ